MSEFNAAACFSRSGHVYQASTKAGVTSRSELSALVRQFNEIEAPSSSCPPGVCQTAASIPSSDNRTRTRPSISSRIGRTASTDCPAGSGSCQSS